MTHDARSAGRPATTRFLPGGLLEVRTVKGLQPEESLSNMVHGLVAQLALTGRYVGTYFHIPNESGEAGQNRLTQLRQAKKRAMGMLPGAPDWFFGGPWGFGFIELKYGRNRLSPWQEDFQAWSAENGCAYAVCRSVQHVEQVLREWGALKVQRLPLDRSRP